MKRERPDTAASGADAGCSKGKAAADEVDELLAALGYKVRSSDMADVAQKLEQLEMAMACASSTANDDVSLLSHLAADTVHYNPSDLSTWLDTMLSELNTPPPPPPPSHHHRHHINFPPDDSSSSKPDQKRKRATRSSSSSAPEVTSSPPMPVVVVDAQEAGIRLVHALMACAEAVQQDNLTAAGAILKQISLLAASQSGPMRKVAGYFAEALARRIYKLNPSSDAAFADHLLHLHFYECVPYLKFAHFTANQAILEAFAGCRRVHVVDLNIRQGLQWPPLLQALALRPGGPPSIRLTGIADHSDALQQVGWKLSQFANSLNVRFQFRGFVAGSLADIQPLDGDEPEAVAVNSVFEFHRLLARPAAIEKVLGTVLAVRPKIVTVVEPEADHNTGPFLNRFTEALHYYSTMFDSLEASGETPAIAGVGGGAEEEKDVVMAEVYLGRQICNVVACEGADRVERHETTVQWRSRLSRAGFEPVHLGSNAFKQASVLLALYAGADGYRVEERDGCLTLGWHTRPLIATSAWRAAADGRRA